MSTGRIYQWWGDEHDPSTNAPAAAALTASSGSAPTNGSVLRFRSRDFDSATDETIQLAYEIPSNYVSDGSLNFRFLSTATSGNAIFKTAWALIHPSTEGTPTDYDAAVFGTVTSSAAQATPATAGFTKSVALVLGLTGAHVGDLLVVMFGRDADAAGDTLAVDAKVLEPWSFTYTAL